MTAPEQSAETDSHLPSLAEQLCAHVHPSVLAQQVFGSCDQCKRYTLALLESDWLVRQRAVARIAGVCAAQRVLAGEDSVEWARGAKASSLALSYAIEVLDDLADDFEDDLRTPPGQQDPR